jgi:hypothetical protein
MTEDILEEDGVTVPPTTGDLLEEDEVTVLGLLDDRRMAGADVLLLRVEKVCSRFLLGIVVACNRKANMTESNTGFMELTSQIPAL